MKSPRRRAVRFAKCITKVGLVALLVSGCSSGRVALADDVVSKPCPCDAEESYFGINGTKIFHVPDQVETVVAQRIAWMKELCVRWDRNDLWWHIVEPQPGKWDFSRPDMAFATLGRHGIHFYPILCYGAAWFTGDRTAPLTEAEFDDYAEYVAQVVRRFADRVRYWEVWNEPNIHEFWRPEPNGAEYTRLLKKAYQAIKRADSDALVCAPAIAPLGPWDRKFVETMYQHGAANYFDVFDYHYYRNHAPEEEVPAEIAEIKAVMRHYDRVKPIQISESGVSSIWEGKSAQDDRQAALVVRNQLLCLALGIDRFYYFDLQNWADDNPSDWASQLGLVTAAGKPKQSFYAYKTLVREVDCRQFIGRHTALGDGIEAVLIYDQFANEYVLAVWYTNEGDHTIMLKAADGDVHLVEPDGVRRALDVVRSSSWVGGRVKVQIDQHPRYVHGVDPQAYLPAAGVRFAHALTILAAGESTSLPIHVDNRLQNARIEVADVKCDAGLLWDATSETLACDAGTPPGIHEVRAVVRVTHGSASAPEVTAVRCVARVEVVSPVTLDPRLHIVDGKLHCTTPVVNHATRAWQDTVHLNEVGRSEPLVRGPMVALAERQTVHVDFAVPPRVFENVNDVTTWHLAFGEHQSAAVRVYPAPLGQGPFEIDGTLDDWVGVPVIAISESERVFVGRGTWTAHDAAAECRVALTKDRLFFAAHVHDDDPAHNQSPHWELWKGDSIELFLGKCGPTRRTVIVNECDVHLAIAPRYKKDEPIVYRHRPDGRLDEARIATRKTPGGYILEVAIPLSALDFEEPPHDGQVFAFDLTLNDGDAGAAKPAHRMTWNGTARNWIDPSDYGVLVVKED